MRTKELLEHGSPSPLVWVLVHGKGIPPNAIVAGEERRQPLYIARTFYEVSIIIIHRRTELTSLIGRNL